MHAALTTLKSDLFANCQNGNDETMALIKFNSIAACHCPEAWAAIEEKGLFPSEPVLTREDAPKINALTRILRAAGLDLTGCYVTSDPYGGKGRGVWWTIETASGQGIVYLRRHQGELMTVIEVVTNKLSPALVGNGADAEIIKALTSWARPALAEIKRRNGAIDGITLRDIVQDRINAAH